MPATYLCPAPELHHPKDRGSRLTHNTSLHNDNTINTAQPLSFMSRGLSSCRNTHAGMHNGERQLNHTINTTQPS